MTSVEQLIEEHESLEALATALEQCAATTEPDVETAIRLKARLSIMLAHHLAGEERAMYPHLATGSTVKLAEASEEFRLDLSELKVDWQAYLTEWSDDVVEGDWEVFGQHTRAMMMRLRARIDRENALLIPLALQNSMVRLRAA